MLLIDGVKYEEWVPEGDRAEEELEQIIKEHASEIFGENSIYFDIKHKLKSKAGTGTIPDGYVLTFGNNPQLHIVEVELFSHSYDHIISQITKIITCLKDSSTWNDIARTIRDEINKDELTAIKAKKAIQPSEVYEFLYDNISNLASLVIIIDKDRIDVREGIGNITHREITMRELRTFKRVGAETIHAHLFKPLYIKEKAIAKASLEKPKEKKVSSKNALYLQFFSELVEMYSMLNPSWHKVKALPQSLLWFGAGKTGLYFEWAFRDNKRFAVDLYIDTGDKTRNKQLFHQIEDRKEIIQEELSLELSWERLDEIKASRIAVYTQGDINAAMNNKKEKERITKWALETMDSFTSILKEYIINLY